MTSISTPRRPSLVPGILIAVLSLIFVAIGGAVTLLSAVGEALLASPEVEVTQTMQVDDLTAGPYAIYLTDEIGEPTISDPVSSITCEVQNGGTTQTVATNPLVSVESSNNQLVGPFTATGGPASITCAWLDGHASTGYTYIITPSKGVPVPAIVLFAVGAALFVFGGLLVVRAVLARRKV